ncbi:MAG TPA: hypothetical protein VJ063_06060, partial [Verrucomicrobiae bacterium]|nr:hypothetical protein [Verrucomicrobiae bacterium]
TDPTWPAGSGSTREGYFWYRTEGYVYPPESSQYPERPRQFHHGGMDIVARSPATILGPSRPVAVFLMQYADQAMRRSSNYFDNFIFGPGFPNSAGYMRENSQNYFTWRRGGIIGPLTMTDDPTTSGNEALWRDNYDMSYTNFLYLSLTASNGNYVIVANAGGIGSTVNANSTAYEDWEQLALVDHNGPPLVSGDLVSFKTSQDWYLREGGGNLKADATSSAALETRFHVYRTDFGSIISNEVPITIRSALTGNYLQAVGGGGAGTILTSASPGTSGRFTIHKASPAIAHNIRLAAQRAGIMGRFNADAYDANGDGAVTSDEITYAVVVATRADSDGGANRRVAPFTVPGSTARVQLNTGALFPDTVSFTTMTHELTHQLGATDLYGACCLSCSLTLMSGTVGAGTSVTFNLDPWHRMRLGWAEPRIFNLRNPGASAWLQTLAETTNPLAAEKSPVLLYDPAHYDLVNRVGEFFMLEYRTHSYRSNSHDLNIPSDGLALWHIKNNSSGGWEIIPSTCPGGGIDPSVFTIGAPNTNRGGSLLWTAANGQFSPRWLDGSNVPIRLSVGPGPYSAAQISVEWSSNGTVMPRLDQLSRSTAQPCSVLTITGVFPVVRSSISSDRVDLVSGLNRYPLTVRSWNAAEITFEIPHGTPVGDYLVEVQNQGVAGNRLRLQLQEFPYGLVGFSSIHSVPPSNWMSLTWTSTTLRCVVVEASTDLRLWQPVYTNDPISLGPWNFTDTRRFPYRFYRIRQ